MHRYVVVSLAASAAVLAGCTPALAARAPAHSPDLRRSYGESGNWSGYVVTGSAPYTSVSASWTQPGVSCASTPTAYSSFWVGLDGDGTTTVEQTGTEASCSGGAARYSAWYEMYPKYPVTLPRKDAVSPGDSLTATVSYLGKGKFKMTLADTSRGWSRTYTKVNKQAERGSAEVIVEAPASGFEILPLADFGTVSFSGADVDGAQLSASTPGLEPLTMLSEPEEATEAEPSALAGGAFTDRWFSE